MEPIILDKNLYEKAKQTITSLYKKPSAYRSMAVVKEYKRLGGRYGGNKEEGKLTRWINERWQDIGNKNYPVFRPTIKVNKQTPLTIQEIDPKNLKQQIALKQKIRDRKNLPAFQKKR